MRLKGIEVRKVIHIGVRPGIPEKDVRLDGTPIRGSNYVSFYYIRHIIDEGYWDDENLSFIDDPENAPAIPVNHGATWYGYGKERNTMDYKTTPVYFAYKGNVYIGTIRK